MPKVLDPVFYLRFFIEFSSSKLDELCRFFIVLIYFQPQPYKLIQRINDISHFRRDIVNILMLIPIYQLLDLFLRRLHIEPSQQIALQRNHIIL